MQTLGLVATNGPRQKGFTFEEPERFKLLIETCPVVFAYMPSIQRRKAHQKTQRNVKFLTPSVPPKMSCPLTASSRSDGR